MIRLCNHKHGLKIKESGTLDVGRVRTLATVCGLGCAVGPSWKLIHADNDQVLYAGEMSHVLCILPMVDAKSVKKLPVPSQSPFV